MFWRTKTTLEALAVLLVALAAITAAAYAINFFWRSGMRVAFGYAAIFVGVFLGFWASGLWENTEKHSWGVLFPVIPLMLAAAWLGARMGRKLWLKFQQNLKK